MQYVSHYQSPLGEILLAADEIGLTGVWFENQRYYAHQLEKPYIEADIPIFEQAKQWLDIYFSGCEPRLQIPFHLEGTDFQQEVWKILSEIPYGQTITYGEIARKLAKQRGIERMAAQAVGSAVGHNSIAIIVPCHRVVGTNGSLTGYAGGLDKKIRLLELEKIDMTKLFVPQKGTIKKP